MKINKVFLMIMVGMVFVLGACNNEKEAVKQNNNNEVVKKNENEAANNKNNNEAGNKSETEETTGENLDNINKEGLPIVKEEVSFDIFAPTTNADYNDLYIWNEYEELSNVKINWQHVQEASVHEKRNLLLASGDLPDAFYTSGLNNLSLFKYAQEGSFIKLNDLIDEHAPNLKELLDEYPEVRKAITFPDGNIYSLPNIQDPEFLSILIGARMWYKESWLEQLNMAPPETTDQFYDYLKAVKETDLNGNGKHDEIPYGDDNINFLLVKWMRGSFGIANTNNEMIDLDPESGDMRFVPTTDRYKEMLEYINKLYEEELINKNIFSIEGEQFMATAAEGLYGSTVFYSPDVLFGEEGKDYIGGIPLKGPHGDQLYSRGNAVGRVDGLVLTSEIENPATLIKWADYFYSDEGAKFFYMGIEGDTYEETSDGKFEFVDEIKNSASGLTLEQEIDERFAWVGRLAPGITKQDYYIGSDTSELSLESAELIKPYLAEESWPGFQYTEEETKILASVGADIDKYVGEMRDKFMSGDIPFSQWDDYVKRLDDMGLAKYMEVQEAGYKRYSDN